MRREPQLGVWSGHRYLVHTPLRLLETARQGNIRFMCVVRDLEIPQGIFA